MGFNAIHWLEARTILSKNRRSLLYWVVSSALLIGVMSQPAEVNPAPLSGQIIVDPTNPAWLKYHGAGPFFMCGPGDPEGFLYRGRRNRDGTRNGDQMALITKLKGTGANSIYVQMIRSHGGDGDVTQNPFVNHDPALGVNMIVLEQWKQWFTELDRNGIAIFFFFYDDGARIWDTGDRVGDAERAFIRTIVGHFKHYRNLIWAVAEEYQEAYSARRVSNIAAEIRAADEHRHIIAVHKRHGLSFTEFATDSNIDQFAIQYNVDSARELHAGVVSAWRNAAGRYNLNVSEIAKHGTGVTARKKNWAIAMAGAYVMVLGWDIASTAVSDLEGCGHLVRFMTATNFSEMAPHDELALADVEYVLGQPGRSYIVYASALSGKMGLKNMQAGSYDFSWYDIAAGTLIQQRNVSVVAGNQTWSSPAGMGTEVALYIRRAVSSFTPAAGERSH
jgi:hypothetical protein